MVHRTKQLLSDLRTTVAPTHAVAIAGGAALASIAGYINAAVMLLDGGLGVTHMTGAISRLSTDAADARLASSMPLLAILGSFMFGAMLSGLLLGQSTLRLGRRYGVAMMLQALLLTLAALTLDARPITGLSLTAAAAGLQNAMASTYAGLIIRTTHMTGVATDLGFLLGRALATKGRSGHVEPWRFLMLLTLLASFFLGGLAGVFAEHRLARFALLLPAAALFAAGLAYYLWRIARQDHVTPTPLDPHASEPPTRKPEPRAETQA
jgi:uncharacterized membrane protein YoaK (UPF0700 family)